MISRRYFLAGLVGTASLTLLPALATAAPTTRPHTVDTTSLSPGPYPALDLYPNDSLNPEG